jgi:glycosyltransferase involved in cell wall biosynthesis
VRILIVTQYFWPEPSRVKDLALALQGRGHEVEVLTGLPNYPAGSFYEGYGLDGPWVEHLQSLPVWRVPVVSRGRRKNWRLALNYASFALSAMLLGPIRLRGRYDAVLIFQPSPVTTAIPGLFMGKLRGAPVLLWIQDLWPDTLVAVGMSPRSFLVRAARLLSRKIHHACDRLLVQSQAYIQRLEAAGVDPARISYLPNWAEDLYRPLERSSVADPMPGIAGFRVVFAGNIGSAQSFETVIEAADRMRNAVDIHWVIVGDGNMAGWLRKEIERRALQGTVHLFGWQPAERMPVLFAHADALLATLRPDPVFGLTIPSKLQTYIACGKPVVAALDGEGATLVRSAGAGIVTAPGDGAALADSVLRLYKMTPEARAAMGASGRAYYERHFARDGLLDRLERYMSEAKKAAKCAY